jgi:hypothetical protein
MVSYSEPEKWINQLKSLYYQPVLGEEVAKRAFEDVKRFTWERRAEHILRSVSS